MVVLSVSAVHTLVMVVLSVSAIQAPTADVLRVEGDQHCAVGATRHLLVAPVV